MCMCHLVARSSSAAVVAALDRDNMFRIGDGAPPAILIPSATRVVSLPLQSDLVAAETIFGATIAVLTGACADPQVTVRVSRCAHICHSVQVKRAGARSTPSRQRAGRLSRS